MIGSALEILAFVLAITFSVTAARYDQRKQNLLAVDLDRPGDIGPVKVSQAAMMDLSNRLEPGGQ